MPEAYYWEKAVNDADMGDLKNHLDGLYARYNRREFVHPDPLEFLYAYPEVDDREVAALVASALAYGRVAQILRSVGSVLRELGPHPARFVDDAEPSALRRTFAGFRHRFTAGEDLAALLAAAQQVRARHGSLGACFASGLNGGGVVPALTVFAEELSDAAGGALGRLLPSPEQGSACKRLCLFLRWMVRRDAVDPGGWTAVSPSVLIVPLDVHMHRVSLALGLTQRKQADLRTAVEATDGFRSMAPDDPVRYDFALTRLGIRSDTDLGSFLRDCRREAVTADA